MKDPHTIPRHVRHRLASILGNMLTKQDLAKRNEWIEQGERRRRSMGASLFADLSDEAVNDEQIHHAAQDVIAWLSS